MPGSRAQHSENSRDLPGSGTNHLDPGCDPRCKCPPSPLTCRYPKVLLRPDILKASFETQYVMVTFRGWCINPQKPCGRFFSGQMCLHVALWWVPRCHFLPGSRGIPNLASQLAKNSRDRDPGCRKTPGIGSGSRGISRAIARPDNLGGLFRSPGRVSGLASPTRAHYPSFAKTNRIRLGSNPDRSKTSSTTGNRHTIAANTHNKFGFNYPHKVKIQH